MFYGNGSNTVGVLAVERDRRPPFRPTRTQRFPVLSSSRAGVVENQALWEKCFLTFAALFSITIFVLQASVECGILLKLT